MGFTASNRLARRMHMQNCNLDGATSNPLQQILRWRRLCAKCARKWRNGEKQHGTHIELKFVHKWVFLSVFHSETYSIGFSSFHLSDTNDKNRFVHKYNLSQMRLYWALLLTYLRNDEHGYVQRYVHTTTLFTAKGIFRWENSFASNVHSTFQ